MSLPFTTTKQVNLSCPASHEVWWTFDYLSKEGVGIGTRIKAKTWFAARAQASIDLGVAPELLRGRMGVH